MFHRVAFKSANCTRVSFVISALTASVLVLGQMMAPAQAAFPGKNGKIDYSHGEGPSSIYVVDADGTGRTNVTPDASTDTNTSPAWSPDGTKVAFSSSMHRSGDELNALEIYIMEGDGTNLRRLTYNDTDDTGPSWSPDGTKIAYTSYGETGFEIYTVNADGTGQTALTNSPERAEDIDRYGDLTRFRDNLEPVWLPDGKKIAFQVDSRASRKAGTYTMNPDGSNQAFITVDGDQLDWSPDGTKMVYRHYPPGQGHSDIFVANADGSSPVNLTASISDTSYEAVPAWSPDGTKIAFSSNLGEKIETDYEIYVIDVDGSNLKRLTHTPGVDWGPDWQPLSKPTEAMPEKQQEQRQQNQQQQPQQGSKSRSETVHPPDTGGPSLLLVASALLFSGGTMFYAGVNRRT
jgi:Tol biopolymer transport system component